MPDTWATEMTTLNEAVKKAEEWQMNGKRWHFHILAIGCKFNTNESHVLIIENTEDKEEVVVYTVERPLREGEMLVKLLHGKRITSKHPAKKIAVNPVMQKIIERADELTTAKNAWHHHVLFPDCRLNKHPGKWCILLEDPSTGELLEALYAKNPTEDLQLLETAFYSQKLMT